MPAPAPTAAAHAAKEAYIALLLPLEAPEFKPAAEAFQNGFNAGQKAHPGSITVRTHSTDASPERIATQYKEALMNGASVVVGPMTRNGVTALASSALVIVPTLSLNLPESNVRVPGLYVFGLPVENEAAIVAQQMVDERYRSVVVVNTANALGRRMRDAFLPTWRAGGGQVAALSEVRSGGNLTFLRELSMSGADVIFLAAGFEEARVIRPYLPSQMPVYTTSQINLRPGDSQRDLDLDGVRFLDMPWVLSPENPRVSIYPPAPGLSGETLRFYALGIDAYRIALALSQGQNAMEFDGVTGRIRVSPDGTVERRPWPAVFRDGIPILAQ